MPAVSVIIPAYNAEAFLARAIRSVERQTYSDFEIVVVDDGSTDGTDEVARGFSGVRCVRRPHLGEAATRNHGLEEAAGDLVAFLDADDEWLPEKLAHQVSFMEKLGSSFSYTDSYVVRDGRRRRYSSLARPRHGEILFPLIDDWLDQAFIPNITVVASRTLLQDVGGFEGGLPTASNADYGLWLKLALRGTRFDYLDEPLALYYRGHASDSSDAVEMVERHRLALRHFASAYDFPTDARVRVERALASSDATLAVELLKQRRFREAAAQLRRSNVRHLARKGRLFLSRRLAPIGR
ncbi:MAG TPA: glycosyltransferase [Gaiellaceae bacterium]|nr:glycosyltransferase [Gaiellaceae bacterium]